VFWLGVCVVFVLGVVGCCSVWLLCGEWLIMSSSWVGVM
jgi:hypothetical protein